MEKSDLFDLKPKSLDKINITVMSSINMKA